MKNLTVIKNLKNSIKKSAGEMADIEAIDLEERYILVSTNDLDAYDKFIIWGFSENGKSLFHGSYYSTISTDSLEIEKIKQVAKNDFNKKIGK